MESMLPESHGILPQSLPEFLTVVKENKAALVFLTPAITIFLWFFVSYHTSPLKKYPGPFLAGKPFYPSLTRRVATSGVLDEC